MDLICGFIHSCIRGASYVQGCGYGGGSAPLAFIRAYLWIVELLACVRVWTGTRDSIGPFSARGCWLAALLFIPASFRLLYTLAAEIAFYFWSYNSFTRATSPTVISNIIRQRTVALTPRSHSRHPHLHRLVPRM